MTETMVEKRKLERRRTFLGGTISPSRGGAIDCMIRNFSTIGACLEVASHVGIPDDFDLITKPDHRKYPCHVAWRKDTRLGVVFRKGSLLA